MSELSNNPYARARFDSVIIDAKNERKGSGCCSAIAKQGASFTDTVCGKTASNPRNPLAVGHKMNHPPSGALPNVIGFAFDFPLEGVAMNNKATMNDHLAITDIMPTNWSLAIDLRPIGPFAAKKFDELIPNSFVTEPSRLSMFGKRAIVHVSSIVEWVYFYGDRNDVLSLHSLHA